MIPTLLGGIGLFLIGMVLLTDGLREAAGDALRELLGRFTRGRGQAIASGALVTTLVQSSSATILTTIGFVSAGLLTLTQAIGVILGAAVGTTSTGWIVAMLGLKYSVTAVALPLVGVGALLRLLGRGRVAAIGISLAGFGLLFVGIATLQTGMEGLTDTFDLTGLGHERIHERLWLVLLGLAMTVVMQSSSAAIATALTALHTGALGLEQTAFLVIGQNVGTAVTSALSTIGASVPARRAALSHVLFNVFSGALALVLMPVYLPGIHWIADGMEGGGDAVSIAAFHTGFNILGVLLFLPFVTRLADWLGQVVADPFPSPTRHLDASVARIPSVAVDAARRATVTIGAELASAGATAIAPAPGTPAPHRMRTLHEALDEVRGFLSRVRTTPDVGATYEQHVSVLHAADHLDRMARALHDAPPESTRAALSLRHPIVGRLSARLGETGRHFAADENPDVPALQELARELADVRREGRRRVLADTASGVRLPGEAAAELDAMRWVDRLAYHLWRAASHLASIREGEGSVRGAGDDPSG